MLRSAVYIIMAYDNSYDSSGIRTRNPKVVKRMRYLFLNFVWSTFAASNLASWLRDLLKHSFKIGASPIACAGRWLLICWHFSINYCQISSQFPASEFKIHFWTSLRKEHSCLVVYVSLVPFFKSVFSRKMSPHFTSLKKGFSKSLLASLLHSP